MRYLLLLALAFMASATMAAEPTYTCRPEQRCIEAQGPTYDIGRGTKISLPSGWKFFSYPSAPDPIMEGLREIRAFKDGVVIAISPFPNIDKRPISESFLCDIVAKSGTQYVSASKEKIITTMPSSHGDVLGCFVAFSTPDDGEKPFRVLPNRRHASVTTFAISHNYIIFSISVVSESPPDDAYLAAVNSIKQLQ